MTNPDRLSQQMSQGEPCSQTGQGLSVRSLHILPMSALAGFTPKALTFVDNSKLPVCVNMSSITHSKSHKQSEEE